MYDVSVFVSVSYLDTTARKVSASYLDTKSGEVCVSYLDTFKKYLWTPLEYLILPSLNEILWRSGDIEQQRFKVCM